jgi:hypothetical protein
LKFEVSRFQFSGGIRIKIMIKRAKTRLREEFDRRERRVTVCGVGERRLVVEKEAGQYIMNQMNAFERGRREDVGRGAGGAAREFGAGMTMGFVWREVLGFWWTKLGEMFGLSRSFALPFEEEDRCNWLKFLGLRKVFNKCSQAADYKHVRCCHCNYLKFLGLRRKTAFFRAFFTFKSLKFRRLGRNRGIFYSDGWQGPVNARILPPWFGAED